MDYNLYLILAKSFLVGMLQLEKENEKRFQPELDWKWKKLK
jgi:hypothetical protein